MKCVNAVKGRRMENGDMLSDPALRLAPSIEIEATLTKSTYVDWGRRARDLGSQA